MFTTSSAMKAVVLALTLALVAGHQNFAPDFAAGKTYMYRYETLLLGGLPEEGLAKAGLKVTSKVLIRAESENLYILKLAEPEIFEISGVWPKDHLIPATKLTSALASELSTPIKFEYTSGDVGKIYAPEQISTMVLNIYRGILNVLQLNLKKTLNVYELQEVGTQGVCKTLYTITNEEPGRYALIKTRDLNHCQERVLKDTGLAYTEKYAKCQQDSKNLRGAATYNYVLKPDASGLRIMEASVKELIQFSPFNEMNGAAQMETRQTLTFLDIHKTPIAPITAQYVQRGSIKYEFSTELLQMPIQLIKISNVHAQIVESLNRLVSYNREDEIEDEIEDQPVPAQWMEHELPWKFLELVQVFRAAQFEDLEAIWSQYKNSSAYRQWILDAIPAIGRPIALRFIKEKFIDLTVAEATQALITSIHMVTADREALRLLQEFATSQKNSQRHFVREVSLLGYGTMISKYCTELTVCPSDVIQPILSRLAEASSRNDEQEIILLLKVLGNSGHISSIKPITKMLPIHGTAATSQTMRVHAEAIMALRNLAKKEPRMIQDLVLQLYMDKALHPELRMLACIVLFESKPAMGLVTTLANVVKTENNLQVASFTYSYMKSLSRSTSIQTSLAAACNIAIRILSHKLDRLSSYYSKAFHMDIYNNPLMLGAAASAFYINDAATILPRSVVAKSSAYLAGAAADLLEVGVRTEGLQEVLLKNPELVDNVDRMTKMKRVIKALSQLRSQPTRAPLGSVYVKLFGQEVAFANIDRALIEEVIHLARGPSVQMYGKSIIRALLSGVSLRFAKPVLAAEMRRILPTAAGFPMELSLYTAAVAGAAVQVKASTTPALPENFHFAHLLKTDIQFETEIRPRVSVNTFAAMGVNTALFQVAIVSKGKLNTILPAKIAARLDIQEGHFKIAALPVSVPRNVAAVRIGTFAVARNLEDLAAAKITPIIPARVLNPLAMKKPISTSASVADASFSKSSEIIPSAEEAKMKGARLNKKYCVKAVAIGLVGCFKVHTKNAAFIRDVALYKLAGRHFVALSFKPIEGDDIERLEMEVQVGPKAAENLIKQINLSQEDILETPVLMKLKKLLIPGLRNISSSSSSSSSRSSSRVVHRKINTTPLKPRKSSSSSSSSSGSSSSSHSSSRSSRSSSSSARSGNRRSRSSSASSLASLFSASSSSSVARMSKGSHKFQRNHLQRGFTSANGARSKISVSSFEAIRTQNKYLGNDIPPTFAIIFRAVRADRRVQGYQLAVYLDKPSARIQIILAALAADNNWKLCADGAALSRHKVSARIAWGTECKEHAFMITTETGLVGQNPAARLRVAWSKLPSSLKRYAKKVYKYIPSSIVPLVFKGRRGDRINQFTFTVVAESDRTVEFIMKTPRGDIYRLAFSLPFTLPFEEIKGLTPFDDLADKIHYFFAKASAAECSFRKDILTTFNNRRFKNNMPLSCYQVLAQDCTDELKFMVLLKKDPVEQNHINVKIADIDIDLYPRNRDVIVKVNGMEIPISNLPYQHPTAKIQIRAKGEGISVYAPSLGLHEVYYDRDSWMVRVVDWMKGQTCGLCGRADGEVKQEYRTPSGRVTQSASSFAHSWVLPAESCRDTTECRMKFESVQLEKQVNIQGQESRCVSSEPVLRCLPGCFPVKTTSVTVGFQCQPADSEILSSTSIDVRETAEAHLACRCTAQCA